jgi:hypothetical protein
MLNVNLLVKNGLNAMTNNAPAILTAFGAVGVVGTAILTGKASFQAVQRIQDAQFQRNLEEGVNTPLTKTEKVQLVWPLYIAATTSGVLSCGAIVMSHRISSKRAAMLAAAYALNEKRIEEYQDKVKEKFGVKKEKETRDELAQDRVNRDVEHGTYVFDPEEGKVFIKDEYTGRYFKGKREDIDRAVNEINREILNSVGGHATLSAFYDVIDLEHVSTSDYFGWNTNEMCEIDWTTCTTPDGKHAVHVFEFVNPPILNPGSNASFR